MFIEVADFVRCPSDHAFEPCILLPLQMSERRVITGTMACPACKKEYPIENGRLLIGSGALIEEPDLTDPPTLQALLGLESPGGYIVLVGAVARHWKSLCELTGARAIGVNAPQNVTGEGELSLLEGSVVGLNDSSVRGVVSSAAHCTEAWLAEAHRIVLPGQRVVVAAEHVPANSLHELATGHGLWVGQK